MTPSENQRNFIYATAIINTARPMTRADFECSECGREKVDCQCFRLPAKKGLGK
jgi:hypothetical protein